MESCTFVPSGRIIPIFSGCPGWRSDEVVKVADVLDSRDALHRAAAADAKRGRAGNPERVDAAYLQGGPRRFAPEANGDFGFGNGLRQIKDRIRFEEKLVVLEIRDGPLHGERPRSHIGVLSVSEVHDSRRTDGVYEQREQRRASGVTVQFVLLLLPAAAKEPSETRSSIRRAYRSKNTA